MPESRRIRLRYPAVCARCGQSLAAGSSAWWDGVGRQAFCAEHAITESGAPAFADAPAVETVPPSGASNGDLNLGAAGASAQREFARRNAAREERIRQAHPHLGGLILALTNDPQSTRAWATGAEGERELGDRLSELTSRGIVALHDRRIPGTRANIDHIVVAPGGVFVVDAKKYAGKVEKRDVGGFFKRDERLFVGRRDCSRLLEGIQKQLAVVRSVLQRSTELSDLPVSGALCFVGAEWSLFARPMQLDGVTVTWPKALVETFEKQQLLSAERIKTVARLLAEGLPPA